MTKRLDLTGQKFGRLTAIRRAAVFNKSGAWFCECECGGTRTVNTGNLRSGGTNSCGCVKAESNLAKLELARAARLPPPDKWDATELARALGY